MPLLSSSAMVLVSPKEADGGGVGIAFCMRADMDAAGVEVVAVAEEDEVPLAKRGSTS